MICQRLHILCIICLLSIPIGLSAQATSTKLRLLSPNGGESFKPGDTVLIEWSGTGYNRNYDREDTVRIEFSGDGGVTWQVIADAFTFIKRNHYDSTYRWIVPSIVCDSCLIRIRQITGNYGFGDTIRSFEIPPLPGGITLHYSPSAEVLFSDTDSLLTIRTYDSIFLWDITSGTLEHVFPMPMVNRPWYSDLRFIGIQFAFEDSLMIVGTEDNDLDDTAYVFIWDVETEELLQRFPHPVVGYFHKIYSPRSASLHPDGATLLSSSSHKLSKLHPTLWNVSNASVIDQIPVWFTHSVDYSPDGERFVLGGSEGVSLWNSSTLENLYRVRGESGFVQFSGDGKFILSYPSILNSEKKKYMRLLDAETGDTLLRLELQSHPAKGHFAKQANRFIINGTVYDFEDRFYYYKRNPWQRFFALTPRGTTVADVSKTGTVTLMGVTGQPADVIDAPFSITGTLPIVINQFLGSVEVGKTNDTLIDAFLVNDGSGDLQVQNIEIISGNVNDFTITSGNGSYTLSAGESASIGLRFSPSDTGLRSAIIEVNTEFGKAEAQLFGFGIKSSTSVEENQTKEDRSSGLAISIHPNPASDWITVECLAERSGLITMLLFDLTGRLLDRVEMGHIEPGRYNLDYDTRDLHSGTYRVELHSDYGNVGRRIIIVR
ncbi:MAG: hypothetical protein J4G05_09050 [Chlorobi bacterium]|nr:hypothetical protein [Chlorobiota bacterium]